MTGRVRACAIASRGRRRERVLALTPAPRSRACAARVRGRRRAAPRHAGRRRSTRRSRCARAASRCATRSTGSARCPGVALAYSSDLLPLDRPVCVVAERQPLGDVLAPLLAGTRVEPLVVGPAEVVLAPTQRCARDPETSRVSVARARGRDGQRDRRVAARRLTRRRRGDRRRAASPRRADAASPRALDASVPGLWLWASRRRQPSSRSTAASAARARSASALRRSTSTASRSRTRCCVTQLDPDVDRAHRGDPRPAGRRALRRRRDQRRHQHHHAPRRRVGAGARVQVRSVAGASASAFGPSLVPDARPARHGARGHEPAVRRRRGGVRTDRRGLPVIAEPAAECRRRRHGGTSGATFSGSARLFDKRAGTGENPLLAAISRSGKHHRGTRPAT